MVYKYQKRTHMIEIVLLIIYKIKKIALRYIAYVF